MKKSHSKGGGQAGSMGGCLKKGGGWNPLTNYYAHLKKV